MNDPLGSLMRAMEVMGESRFPVLNHYRRFVELPNVTSEDIKRAGDKLNKIKQKRTKRGFRG